ncbi:MAG TPA: hypothetical protein PLF70_01560 [Candidatus Portnoybacteria bacterium]|jgi:hypothetical protein|nr:hypothetical protein [Candidatus Portnoybacteria bacterium]MDD5752189.1 hypothetical protein [Candidatus Portnoybacteria bacterium]HOZ16555.1 hypothetical protein [Candidatus Portnoybacteria bacterium]HPH52182.1 hypothetical protein [Candidatus Portnoybacteria bacterium]HPJ80371.1 hypothetical protein [Candidatus Portnoybacteria bacterium]
MKYTTQALDLMKKYTVKCKINWDNLDGTIFQFHIESRAKQLGLNEITVNVVRWYWLEKHNEVLENLYVAGKIEEDEKNYCKTFVKNREVFHRDEFIEKLEGV